MSKCDVLTNFEVVVNQMVDHIVDYVVGHTVNNVEGAHTESHKKCSQFGNRKPS